MRPRQLNMYRAWQSGAASATRLTSRPTLRPILRRHRIRNVNRQQGARTYFRTQQSLSIQAAPLKHMARVDAVCRQPPSPLSPHCHPCWKCSSSLAGTHIINVPSFSMDKFLFQGEMAITGRLRRMPFLGDHASSIRITVRSAVEVPTIVASDVTGRAQVAQPESEDASRVVGHSDRTVPSTDVCVTQETINVAFHHRRMLTSLGSRRLGAPDHPLIR